MAHTDDMTESQFRHVDEFAAGTKLSLTDSESTVRHVDERRAAIEHDLESDSAIG